jgi:hypothetical protein
VHQGVDLAQAALTASLRLLLLLLLLGLKLLRYLHIFKQMATQMKSVLES